MKRSPNQNNAMHQYFREVADLCMATGTDMKILFENVEITYHWETLKILWRSIALKKFGVGSTSDLETWQVTEVYEEFNRILGNNGLHVPFPSRELEDQLEN